VRQVKISSLSLPGMSPEPDRISKVIERAAKWIDMSANDGPDLITLPESFNGLGLDPEEWANSAEEVTGPSAEMISEKASEHSTYIVCPIVRRDPEGIHNSAILFDREGEQVGIYDKVHPTIGEIEQGIIPGTEGLVLDTDFGRVGFAICFDLNFRDIRQYYLENRPDIVVFPSMYRGGIQLGRISWCSHRCTGAEFSSGSGHTR
jgi:predicted amidohydrolase